MGGWLDGWKDRWTGGQMDKNKCGYISIHHGTHLSLSISKLSCMPAIMKEGRMGSRVLSALLQ